MPAHRGRFVRTEDQRSEINTTEGGMALLFGLAKTDRLIAEIKAELEGAAAHSRRTFDSDGSGKQGPDTPPRFFGRMVDTRLARDHPGKGQGLIGRFLELLRREHMDIERVQHAEQDALYCVSPRNGSFRAVLDHEQVEIAAARAVPTA